MPSEHFKCVHNSHYYMNLITNYSKIFSTGAIKHAYVLYVRIYEYNKLLCPFFHRVFKKGKHRPHSKCTNMVPGLCLFCDGLAGNLTKRQSPQRNHLLWWIHMIMNDRGEDTAAD